MWSQCESPSKLHFAWEKCRLEQFQNNLKDCHVLRVSLGFWNAPWKINGWNLKNGPLEKEKSSEPNHFGVPAVNFPGCISVQKKSTVINISCAPTPPAGARSLLHLWHPWFPVCVLEMEQDPKISQSCREWRQVVQFLPGNYMLQMKMINMEEYVIIRSQKNIQILPIQFLTPILNNLPSSLAHVTEVFNPTFSQRPW